MKWTDQEQRRINQASALGSLSTETIVEQSTRFIEKIEGDGTPKPTFDQILRDANAQNIQKNRGPTHARRQKDRLRFRLR